MSTEECPDCGRQLSRTNYFPRQLLTAECMREEQAYLLERMRRRNRLLHGFGVVCGLEVKPKAETEGAPQSAGSEVWVCPGFAVTPEGDEVLVDEPVCVDLANGKSTPSPCCEPWPCPPVGLGGSTKERDTFQVWLALRYAECLTRPVRVPTKGCGCDETACDYSRIRDSFEIRVLRSLPESHSAATSRDTDWRRVWKEWGGDSSHDAPGQGMPVPDCPGCPPDPWVVLARVVLRKSSGQPLRILSIDFNDRRVLLPTQLLQAITLP